jgi:tetratricopeptide (TPR) repeat protein
MAQAPAASTQPKAAQQQPPAAQQQPQAAQQQPPAATQQPAPKKGGMPQAKTQEEFKAYQAAVQSQSGTDLAGAEAAADKFAAQYPDSDLRSLLYTNLMNIYQQANNADKTVEYGRKVIALDPDNPVALVMVSTVLAERTRDTDLDKDERFAEAVKDAKHALESVDTMALPPNTPPDRAEAAKNTVRSMAYGALGTVESTQQNYAAAEQDLRKSVETPGIPPDPLTMLRLAVTLDHAKKYAEALQVANKCVEIAQEPIKGLAAQERDRLVKLTAAPAPAATPGAATSPASPAPPATPKPPQN